MDGTRFDSLTRMFASVADRRTTARALSGAAIGALALSVGAADAKKKRKKCKGGKKKCGKRCIPKASCCTARDCPEGKVCRDGRCADCVTPDDCPDAPTCEEAVCQDGQCATVLRPVGFQCGSNRFCVGNETCDGAGVCGGGVPRDCDDGIACTDDSCDEFNNECVHEADDNRCATDNPCVVGRCDPDDAASDQDGCVFENITGGSITCGVGACQRTVQQCVDGEEQPCVPGQPSPEVCNGIDDDCDGTIDDGATCTIDSPATCGRTGACAGGSCQLYGPQTVCRSASCIGHTKELEARCDGSGTCPPSQTQNCAPYRCSSNGIDCIGFGGCGGDIDCVSDHFCFQSECRPKRENGESCQLDTQCVSGFCDAGTCRAK